MKLLEFIKDNVNWRDILTKEPYCISIKEKNGYVLFKYNQIDSEMSNAIVQECRGVIIDLENMKVACRPFDKFFNWGESNAATLSGKIRAEEKVDGSLMKIWLDRDGKTWNLSTNGMIDANDAEIMIPTEEARTYAELFDIAWRKCGVNMFDLDEMSEYTFMFELVSPLNRIVVPYKETEIYFLGVRNNETGEEIYPAALQEGIVVDGVYKVLPWNEVHRVKVPRLYDIDTLEQAVEVAKTLSGNEEGFVLVDENFNRVKVKGAEYLSLHLFRNNSLSLKSFLATLLNDNKDDLLSYFPEYEPYINDVEVRLNAYCVDVEEAIASAPFELDRKEFALQVKDSVHSAILFKMYGNREYDWRKEVLNIDNINRLAQLLGI